MSLLEHLFALVILPTSQIVAFAIAVLVGLAPLYLTAAMWWCIVLLLEKKRNGRPARPLTIVVALLASSYVLVVTGTAIIQLADILFQGD